MSFLGPYRKYDIIMLGLLSLIALILSFYKFFKEIDDENPKVKFYFFTVCIVLIVVINIITYGILTINLKK